MRTQQTPLFFVLVFIKLTNVYALNFTDLDKLVETNECKSFADNSFKYALFQYKARSACELDANSRLAALNSRAFLASEVERLRFSTEELKKCQKKEEDSCAKDYNNCLIYKKTFDSLKIYNLHSNIENKVFAKKFHGGIKKTVNKLCVNSSGAVIGNFKDEISRLCSDELKKTTANLRKGDRDLIKKFEKMRGVYVGLTKKKFKANLSCKDSC